jgi:cytochrome P450
MGQNWGVTPLQYGPDWRIGRKLLHEQFHQQTIYQYAAAQEKFTNDLILHLKNDPKEFATHVTR